MNVFNSMRFAPTDSQGFSSMHWAAKRGDYEVLCQLQESGANLDTPASFDTQMRPIHWAASDAKLKSVKFLLDNRQDINAQDGNGCSPVIIAAQYGRVDMVIYLVKNGADLNQRDVNGDTALHWAAYKGFEEVAGVLMHFTPQFKDLPDNFGQVKWGMCFYTCVFIPAWCSGPVAAFHL